MYRKAQLLSCRSAYISVGMGLIVLLCWSVGFYPFMQILDSYGMMNPTAALLFIFCGVSLAFSIQDQAKNKKLLSILMSWMVVIIATIKLFVIIGLDLEVDKILFQSRAYNNEMSIAAAFNFLLVGCALLFSNLERRQDYRISDYFAVPVFAVSVTVIVGHVYSSDVLVHVGSVAPMALSTSVTFVVLSIGVLCRNPQKGILGILFNDCACATVGRKIFPFVVLAPPLLGWLRVQGQSLGLISAEFGSAMLAAVGTLLGSAIFLSGINIVNKLERNLRVRDTEDNERKLKRLKRFFPPAIAEGISTGEIDDPFKWHRNDVTVIFIDIRGFTTFAETVEPEEVMSTLHDYYLRIARVAQRHNGSIGHLAGDGVMIFFNDPMPVEDPQKKAVLMALEVREEMISLCDKWKTKNLNLNFGAGIASGFTTIGGIGAEGFWDYTVVGATPNMAARLCGAAKEGQILVSKRFLNAVEDLVDVESVGSLSLKGINIPVTAFNITRKKAA